jgi:hypothetical protein
MELIEHFLRKMFRLVNAQQIVNQIQKKICTTCDVLEYAFPPNEVSEGYGIFYRFKLHESDNSKLQI